MAQPTMDADEAAFLTGLKDQIVAAIVDMRNVVAAAMVANTVAINATGVIAQTSATSAASAASLVVATTAATAEAVRLAVLEVKATTAATAEAVRLAVLRSATYEKADLRQGE